ncbi:MAG: hypothetical protein ABR562_02890 [Thermoplasmatota archaeon]
MRGFTACMRCGSLALRGVKASEGAIGVAFFDLSKCRDCGWQGNPIEFDDEASWRDFVAAQAGKDDSAETAVPLVIACPQCGARDLRFEGTAAACPHCRWRGTPLEFASEAARLEFAERRKNEKGRSGEAA